MMPYSKQAVTDYYAYSTAFDNNDVKTMRDIEQRHHCEDQPIDRVLVALWCDKENSQKEYNEI